jgi:hypothetical protein
MEYRIGCSGYYYPQWKNKLYPKNIAPKNWLAHYNSVFNTVELNGTFYRTPKLTMAELLDRLDAQLQKSLGTARIDPAYQVLIDNRFRTLVLNELNKNFAADLRLVSNLEDIINNGSTLKEIQLKVQFEINSKKLAGKA